MATDPIFFTIPNSGAALLGAAETSLTVPTTTSTLITAGANGTKIEEIALAAVAAASVAAVTVAGLVFIFLHDGTTSHLRDVFAVPAVTGSATAVGYTAFRSYSNLILKTGWTLRASQSVAGNASLLKCTVVAADA